MFEEEKLMNDNNPLGHNTIINEALQVKRQDVVERSIILHAQGFNFQFFTSHNNLVINVSDKQFFYQFYASSMIQYKKIRTLIEQNKVKILSKTKQSLQLSIGMQFLFQLISKQYIEPKQQSGKFQTVPANNNHSKLLSHFMMKKSNKFKTDGTLISMQQKSTKRYQFFILNSSFNNTQKNKQSWAVKIIKITGGIFIGIFMQSKIKNIINQVNSFQTFKPSNGSYLIGPNGWCYSNSSEELNCMYKSFLFGANDVIYIEYDIISKKLRFSKNKVEIFEMPIIAPPQNDAYLPCIAFQQINSSVQIIPINILSNDQTLQEIKLNKFE